MTEEDPWAAAAIQQEKDENVARLSNTIQNLTAGEEPSPGQQGGFTATSKVFGAFKLPENITPGSTHAFGSSAVSQSSTGTSSFGGSQPVSGGSTFGGSSGGGESPAATGTFKGGFGSGFGSTETTGSTEKPGSFKAGFGGFGGSGPKEEPTGSFKGGFGGFGGSGLKKEEGSTGSFKGGFGSGFGGGLGNGVSAQSGKGGFDQPGKGGFEQAGKGGFSRFEGSASPEGEQRSPIGRPSGLPRQPSQEDNSIISRGPGWASPPSTPGTPESPEQPLRLGRGLGTGTPSPPPSRPGGAGPRGSWSQHDDRTETDYGQRQSQASPLTPPQPRPVQPQHVQPRPLQPQQHQQPPQQHFPPQTGGERPGIKKMTIGAHGDSISNNRPNESWDAAELQEGDEGASAVGSMLNKLLHDQLIHLNEKDVDINNVPTNSPLFSVKSFHELRLKEDLVRGVHAMGFHAPSKIQEVALPVLIGEPPTNMVAQSQSGTGKTAAFVLTMLNRVDATAAYPQCLCLAPTYELAMQIGTVVEKMGKFLPDIRVAYAVRGNRLPRGHQLTEQIVIGTPGTALDWVTKLRVLDPTLLRVFVLDEADVMISEQGHKDQSIRIKRTLSPECQLLLFSATYDDQVMAFAEKIVDVGPQGEQPMMITVRREEQTLDTILQYVTEVASREEKFDAIHNLYGCLTIGQSIIFCHTKASANWLSNKMREAGHVVGILSGELPVEERARVIQRFKNGEEKVLITTNVCSRGIDVRQVTLVINYDVPMLVEEDPSRPGRFRPTGPDFETYLHRIGRTGRFGKAGIAVNFVDSDLTRRCMNEIQEYFGKEIAMLDPSDLDALEQIEEESRRK